VVKQELSFMLVTDSEPSKVLRNSEILIITLLGDKNGFIINVNPRGAQAAIMKEDNAGQSTDRQTILINVKNGYRIFL
jgi:hypothetical protein